MTQKLNRYTVGLPTGGQEVIQGHSMNVTHRGELMIDVCQDEKESKIIHVNVPRPSTTIAIFKEWSYCIDKDTKHYSQD